MGYPVVVLPIGHLLGGSPAPESGATVYRVRVGPDIVRLTAAQFTLWALAHGTPGAARWRPDDVLAAADGLADAAELLTALVDDGLVATLEPATEGARAFARRHRFVPLMLGLGNLSDDPDVYEIGLPGQPVAQVGEVLARLYQWGHLEPDLWAACRATALVVGDQYPRFADPDRLLAAVLSSVHTLLGPNAAYLDTAA